MSLRLTPLPALLAASLLVGCGSSLHADHTTTWSALAQHQDAAGEKFASALSAQQKVAIDFRPGDELPVKLTVDGPLVALKPTAANLRLVAKRPFVLLVRPDGPPVVVSRRPDGTLEREGGSFAAGLAVTRETTEVTVGLRVGKEAPDGR